MARYGVLRPIEHNLKLYIPAIATSAANGNEIPVDASGWIELSEQEASRFVHGQIQPMTQGAAPAATRVPASATSESAAKAPAKLQPRAPAGNAGTTNRRAP
jgi:hypothetical protein